MRKILVAILIAQSLALSPIAVRGDSNSNADMGTPLTGPGKRTGRRMRAAGGKTPGSIRGHCTLLASVGNPLPGPCIDTVLILDNAAGEEEVRTRTDSRGNFEFSATQGAKYTVKSGSKFYDIVPPDDDNTTVRGGDSSVDLKMTEK